MSWKTRMRILSLKRMNSLLLLLELRRRGVRDGTRRRVAECLRALTHATACMQQASHARTVSRSAHRHDVGQQAQLGWRRIGGCALLGVQRDGWISAGSSWSDQILN
jgi:hypothetical protein